MGLPCINPARICDGCMACQTPGEEIALCAECGEPIYAHEDRYVFPDGAFTHDDCGISYVNQHYFVVRG